MRVPQSTENLRQLLIPYWLARGTLRASVCAYPIGTRVVNRTCATMILLKRDSTYSGRFQNRSRIIFH